MTDILIVEDEPTILEMLCFLFNHEGWRVEAVSRGDEVLAHIARSKPRMIVLDVMLPGRSGFDLLKALRDDPALADIPILILTARGQSRDRQIASDLKADGFITKPFGNDVLLAEIRRLLSLHESTAPAPASRDLPDARQDNSRYPKVARSG